MQSFLSKNKRLIAAALGLVVGAAVVACGVGLDGGTECAGPLSFQAICALGILACCIIWWVAQVLPEFVTGLLMVGAFVVVCGVPTETALSSFSSPTWWLLTSAFGLGYAMQASGLLTRMAHAILRAFPQTFKMQAAGLIAAGTLIGPFIPSLAAKASMLAPLSLRISDEMGYPRQGKGASGLFLAMFTGIRNVGPAVISASIIGYGLLATLPDDVASQFNMVSWFMGMLPWFIIVTILNYAAIVAIFSPDRQGEESAGNRTATCGAESVCGSACEGEGEDGEPWTKPEKRMAAIMVCCVVLWILEPITGVEAHVVALGALCLTLALKVVDIKGFRSGIAWDSLIFIGCAIGLAEVFAHLGIDEWVVGLCAPMFQSVAQSPYLMVVVVGLLTTVLRFVIVSDMAYINVFMAFMVPLATMAGVSPWVVGVCAYAMVDPWFALYQNPIYLTSFYSTEGKMIRNSVAARYCLIYTPICLLGLLASVPYWQWLGVL